MPWLELSPEAQRLEFCRLADTDCEVPFTTLCSRFGVTPKTGYKWLNRYRVEGPVGLSDRSRRPKSSPFQTGPVIEGLVCDLRRKHPAWGGRKLRRRLLDLGHTDVPAAGTITGILRRNGLLESSPRQAGGWTRFEAEAPNDLWQMDHKGWFMTGEGRCDPFDVLDDHSRYNLMLDASRDQETLTVQPLLVRTFETYGMPLRILCDNGGPWGNTQPGFRWTSLTVWLVDLGVTVVHSRPRHPQTLGKDERFHRTLKHEVISTRPNWESHTQVQHAFDKWRVIYNHQRPHEALDLAVPATRYQPSPRSMPDTIEPIDYPDSYQTRKVSNDGRISLRGRLYRIGKPFRGRTVGIYPTTNDGIYTVTYRHQTIKTLDMTQ